jgi:hypothetical protein
VQPRSQRGPVTPPRRAWRASCSTTARRIFSEEQTMSARGFHLVSIGVALFATAHASAQEQNATPSLEERVKQLEEQLRELRARTLPPALPSPPEPAPASAAEPFAWGDFTWLNGSSRQTERLLATKYFTPQLDVDVNYTYSFNHPIDNTVVGSTALARNNELELSFLGLGGDFYAKGVRARLMLQYGTRSTVVPRNDGSVLRGQFDLATIYRYISEAYAGYHVNWLHGVTSISASS